MFVATQSGWLNAHYIVRVKMYRLVGEQWVVTAEMSDGSEMMVRDNFEDYEDAKEFLNGFMAHLNGETYLSVK